MRETKDVRVKALEWETDGEVWWVRGNAPRYEVGPQMSWGCRLHFGGSLIGSPTGDWFLSQGAAKAAAQADYERRIRSALVEAQPAPSPDAELVRVLRDARAIVESDMHAAEESGDGDWLGMSRQTLNSIDALLSKHESDQS